MTTAAELKRRLLEEAEKLYRRNALSKTVTPDYFEPGMMEYLDKSDMSYDAQSNILMLRFEGKGTRYEGRTEEIEKLKAGDIVCIERDSGNEFNPNNFAVYTQKGRTIAQVPAELCNAIAPLYDAGMLEIVSSCVSYVEPLSKRSRYAKQAMVFLQAELKLYC